jgi:hypothetical protein
MKKSFFSFLALTCIVCGCGTAGTNSTTAPGSSAHDNSSLLKTIADRQANAAEVERAMIELGPVSEPPQFWADIANDQSYSVERRRLCILLLFRRHVHAGMTLAEVAEKLHNPDWLPDKDIILVDLVAGLIPVRTVFGDTVFALILLPEKQGDKVAVYLRISGNVGAQEVGEVLRGKVTSGRVAESKVAEIGF